MKINKLKIQEAIDLMKARWINKTSGYSLSSSDGYTDGFWDGRLWAAIRIAGEFPSIDKKLLLKTLDIHYNELMPCKVCCVETSVTCDQCAECNGLGVILNCLSMTPESDGSPSSEGWWWFNLGVKSAKWYPRYILNDPNTGLYLFDNGFIKKINLVDGIWGGKCERNS